MPGPLLTFEGHNNTCGCFPPDSDGDVGPNHYVEAVNESIKIFDKNGNTLSGPTSYNSFFAGLTGTPCANANDGDPFVLYDPVANRWLICDFAFPSFPGTSFYQCIGISQTPDPVAGGWFLYALQVDPANPTFLGDYPKFAMWNAGGSPAQNAYFLTMNLFSSNTTFNGVRVYALNRASMLAGGPANAIGFTLSAADVLLSYSFLAANQRTDSPPAGRNEMVLAINSSLNAGDVFPPIATQQQDWTNGNDGLWRWNSSIAVDPNGNTVIGYSTSNASAFPGIRYAGRLVTDPPNNLSQGEGTMFNGTASQTGSRWGDYSMTTVDTANGTDFWHVNEYLATTGTSWHTRIGKFNFVGGASPTPTATPAMCTWGAGAAMPSVGVREVGVYFPANGKFYAMGGRSSDLAGNEFTHPFEYTPASNSWVTKAATYPDNLVNNMACGVLTDAGTPYIYCAGGSFVVTPTVTTGRVFRYNPVTDTISPVAAPWPAAGTTVLPGGFTVLSNKLYILGGFDTPTNGGQGTNQIWEFTPSPAAWVQKPTVLPVPLGYIPTTTIGTLIYTGGGSDITAGALTDTTNSFVYNPVANTIGTIATIPPATGETRALNFCNRLYVMC